MLHTISLSSLSSSNGLTFLSNDIQRKLPCSDLTHQAPLFYPNKYPRSDKVLVADVEKGTGTLIHADSSMHRGLELWALSEELSGVVKGMVEQKATGIAEVKEGEAWREQVDGGVQEYDDQDWEIVGAPEAGSEKFVLLKDSVKEKIEKAEGWEMVEPRGGKGKFVVA